MLGPTELVDSWTAISVSPEDSALEHADISDRMETEISTTCDLRIDASNYSSKYSRGILTNCVGKSVGTH